MCGILAVRMHSLERTRTHPYIYKWSRYFSQSYMSFWLVSPRRWGHVLWWWEDIPRGRTVAEGISWCHLLLHMLWRPAGKASLPVIVIRERGDSCTGGWEVSFLCVCCTPRCGNAPYESWNTSFPVGGSVPALLYTPSQLSPSMAAAAPLTPTLLRLSLFFSSLSVKCWVALGL